MANLLIIMRPVTYALQDTLNPAIRELFTVLL